MKSLKSVMATALTTLASLSSLAQPAPQYQQYGESIYGARVYYSQADESVVVVGANGAAHYINRYTCAQKRQIPAPAPAELYYSDSCSSNYIGRVDMYTDCNQFSNSLATWGVIVNGRCTNVTDAPSRAYCQGYKMNQFATVNPQAVVMYYDDGNCHAGKMIGVITPATDCQSFSGALPAWGVKTNGQCSNISDTPSMSYCRQIQDRMRGDLLPNAQAFLNPQRQVVTISYQGEARDYIDASRCMGDDGDGWGRGGDDRRGSWGRNPGQGPGGPNGGYPGQGPGGGYPGQGPGGGYPGQGPGGGYPGQGPGGGYPGNGGGYPPPPPPPIRDPVCMDGNRVERRLGDTWKEVVRSNIQKDIACAAGGNKKEEFQSVQDFVCQRQGQNQAQKVAIGTAREEKTNRITGACNCAGGLAHGQQRSVNVGSETLEQSRSCTVGSIVTSYQKVNTTSCNDGRLSDAIGYGSAIPGSERNNNCRQLRDCSEAEYYKIRPDVASTYKQLVQTSGGRQRLTAMDHWRTSGEGEYRDINNGGSASMCRPTREGNGVDCCHSDYFNYPDVIVKRLDGKDQIANDWATVGRYEGKCRPVKMNCTGNRGPQF